MTQIAMQTRIFNQRKSALEHQRSSAFQNRKSKYV